VPASAPPAVNSGLAEATSAGKAKRSEAEKQTGDLRESA